MSGRPRVTHQTRSARRRRQTWLRAGIWIFLIIFAMSVVGIGFISVNIRR
ncbi:MAG: hypothetical protein M3R35_02820 [Candidatus Eremiobacteraeota bacterium]|nr:hypothetical protein [Candidatus Eremiobacteraeota bacterium]